MGVEAGAAPHASEMRAATAKVAIERRGITRARRHRRPFGFEESMKYLIAILFPPLGLLLVGRIGQALLCLLLMITIIGWPLAALWALLVVNSAETEGRVRRAIEQERRRVR